MTENEFFLQALIGEFGKGKYIWYHEITPYLVKYGYINKYQTVVLKEFRLNGHNYPVGHELTYSQSMGA